jgi:hypothetical protein
VVTGLEVSPAMQKLRRSNMNFSEYSSENLSKNVDPRRNSLYSMSLGFSAYGVDWQLFQPEKGRSEVYHFALYHQGNQFAPDRCRQSSIDSHRFSWGIGAVWHLLIKLLVNELSKEQQIDYLNRCWRLNSSETEQKSLSATLKRLWVLMR